jgi:hypothetical protein
VSIGSLRTKDGKWFHDPDGRTPVEDVAAVAIKQAIEQLANITT